MKKKKAQHPRQVFTYFDPIVGVEPEEQTRLLLLWQDNWKAKGYSPRILSEFIARQHPMFDSFSRRVTEFPTVNPPAYERACYMRYLAMCVVGGGLLCDYDVFTYDAEFDFGTNSATPDLYQGHVPCLVYGNVLAYESIVLGTMNYKVTEQDFMEGDSRPHVSDMYIFLRKGIEYNEVRNAPTKGGGFHVKSFGEDGWETAPFIHFSNASMAGKRPRHQHIRGLRNW
jgi:hypothetical protein